MFTYTYKLRVRISLYYRGAQIGAKDMFRFRPIHLAVHTGSNETLQFLLKKGHEMDVGGYVERLAKHDWSVLHVVAMENHIQTMEVNICFLGRTKNIITARKTPFFREVLCSVAFVCCFIFVSNSTVFYKKYSRYLNQTFRHNFCRPPEQIKFKYHDSNSLLWLDKAKKLILDLDLDLERSLLPQSMDGMSEFLHDGSPVCKLAGVHCESV